MEENIRFAYMTKDQQLHEMNVSGCCTLIDAVLELVQSMLNGDSDVKPEDIIQLTDIKG